MKLRIRFPKGTCYSEPMESSGDTKGFTLLYIYGSGRCGSTLLDLLLNGHSKILGLGEISDLMDVFDPFELPDQLSSTFGPIYLGFWERVGARYEEISGEVFEQAHFRAPGWGTITRTWKTEEVQRMMAQRALLLSCAHEVSDAPIVTDSSKRFYELYLLHQSELFRMKVIHLIRDGRAVGDSYLRRSNRFASFVNGIRVWAVRGLLAFWIRKKIGRDNWLRIDYEELAAQPEQTLKIICHFLGVEFEPNMLEYRSHPYLGVRGNPRVKNAEDEEISLDEGWKEELPWRYRLTFAVIMGWLNKLYGYSILR